MLKIRNAHERDGHLMFDEPTHIYTIDGDSKYKSVTTWIHDFFPHFNADLIIGKMRNGRNWNADNKYFNMTDEEIKASWDKNGKEAAEAGTKMHLNIEYYYNDIPFEEDFIDGPEHKLFQKYLKDYGHYKAYRTEWAVYTKVYKLAGSIDMVYVDPDDPDKVIIADWKRCREIKYDNHFERGYGPLRDIDNCNYWHYALQLNVYRMILEKYYGKSVSRVFLVVLHPNQKSYIRIDMPKLVEPIMGMLEVRKRELANASK